MINNVYENPGLEILYAEVEVGFNGSDGENGGGISIPGWEII